MFLFHRRPLLCFFLSVSTVTLLGNVVLNEVHYDPDVKTQPVEFIELYNTSMQPVNLSGWTFTSGVTYTFPGGASIPAKGYAVVAQDPSALFSKFGAQAYGPWTGKLENNGEEIVLVNASGAVEDRVQYQIGFPWPTIGDTPGYSIELINPEFDNNLGGNWRVSVAGGAQPQALTLLPAQSSWRYFKGWSEASQPSTSWRAGGFDDSGWDIGNTPVGYGNDLAMGAYLDDMPNGYTTVFFRNTFQVTNLQQIAELVLEVRYDDGFNLWINGINVADDAFNMPGGEVAYDGTAITTREDAAFVEVPISSPQTFLVQGKNVIAVQVANASIGSSSDFFFDLQLSARTGSASRGPTPGKLNSIFATNAPPQIRQVEHVPKQPKSGEPVLITAKVTDPQGVQAAVLEYQRVLPGAYISIADPAFQQNWTLLTMNDGGTGGDLYSGDGIYSVQLPGNLQTHRALVRYRIRATDGTGATIQVPYADDPQPNFAYFCYDGVPDWRAALRPGAAAQTFPASTMSHLPAVHLVAKNSDVEEATWWSRYGGDDYPWPGTLVYDGEVYDHVHYRARGGVWRYAMVKNMWKFDLNRGHSLQMRDDYGRKYKTEWNKLNLGASIQQRDFWHRGEQGMFESVGFRLFNLAGVPSPVTSFVQFRVIDDPAEADSTSQYEGDFWGVYLAVEQEDGRFLDEHGLPDGNLYKMENGTGELNNLGPEGPTDKSDLNDFLNTYRSTSPAASYQWWTNNLDLNNYFSYQAIAQGIHHYDICYGKNYFYYLNPETRLWSVHTWDLDLAWADNMFDAGCGGIDDLYYPVLGGNNSGHPIKPQIIIGYKNRVRELRDLLFNTNQAWQVIDEYAHLLKGTNSSTTILDADRAQWDFNPKMSNQAYSSAPDKAGVGEFYKWSTQSATIPKTFAGAVQLMKDYVRKRSATLDSLANDGLIPQQPQVTYTGNTNFSLNQLTFIVSSSYAGAYPFAAMKWRVGEVSDPAAPAFDASGPVRYEIDPVWESPELASYQKAMTLPAQSLKVGHAYRVRARMKDTTGRWSRWSAPIQFTVNSAEGANSLAADLRITELMYAPLVGNDFEFIELLNTSAETELDLTGAAFTSGIDFAFPAGARLVPGAYGLVIRHADPAAFRAHYGLAAEVPIFGPYSGSLRNEGEEITLKTATGGLTIFSFEYGTGRFWPIGAQGVGHSLIPLTFSGQDSGALDYFGNWRPSAYLGGSPGRVDPALPEPPVLLNEFAAHTDYSDPAHPEYDSNDWIELFNPGSAIFTFGPGWFLSDDPALPKKWPLPPASVSARSYISFDEVTGFHSPIVTGFGLNKAGESLFLSYLAGGAQDRVVDGLSFKGQATETSYGRYPDGARFWSEMRPSQNVANLAGTQSVVIAEVMYHPPDVGTNDNTQHEYVELFNASSSAITFEDTNGVWRLDGGIAFTFPPSISLEPGGTLLMVGFDPNDTAALSSFRAAYNLTDPLPRLIGPYTGKLGNRGDRVAVERPQYPDVPADPYSWIVVDELVYANQEPFPETANGLGASLQRSSVTAHGMDPASWSAASPTPGRHGSGSTDDDNDGMPNAWEEQFGLDPQDPTDALEDLDGDGMTNLAEFRAGTDPTSAASALRFDSVTNATGQLRLKFTATANRTYTVQFRGVANSGQWQTLTSVPAGEPRGVEIMEPVTGEFAARFYRLVTPALP